MDTAQVLKALTQASLFELYRLSVAIDQQLRDPKRLQAIKNTLQVGQTVECQFTRQPGQCVFTESVH